MEEQIQEVEKAAEDTGSRAGMFLFLFCLVALAVLGYAKYAYDEEQKEYKKLQQMKSSAPSKTPMGTKHRTEGMVGT